MKAPIFEEGILVFALLLGIRVLLMRGKKLLDTGFLVVSRFDEAKVVLGAAAGQEEVRISHDYLVIRKS